MRTAGNVGFIFKLMSSAAVDRNQLLYSWLTFTAGTIRPRSATTSDSQVSYNDSCVVVSYDGEYGFYTKAAK